MLKYGEKQIKNTSSNYAHPLPGKTKLSIYTFYIKVVFLPSSVKIKNVQRGDGPYILLHFIFSPNNFLLR